MDPIKKDTVVVTIGAKFTCEEFTQLDKLSTLIEEQRQKGMTRTIFSNRWPLLSYDPQTNPRCLFFLETREETDGEYNTRIQYESTLNQIDEEMDRFIFSVCSLPLDSPGLLDGSLKKEYQRLVYKYQKTSIQLNPYNTSFMRLNQKNHLFFPISELTTRSFAYPKKTAASFIKKWTEKHPSTEQCPVSYRDTLNIPFQEIKDPG